MSLKDRIRAVFARLALNDLAFRAFAMLAKPYLFAAMVRGRRQREIDQARLYETLPAEFRPGVVLHGPFQGMRYPVAQAAGSSFPPKILGSYERELHPLIGAYSSRRGIAYVDVGCAEGYYAVGLAMKNPGCMVYAFDTDPKARELCDAMARANDVGDRVVLGSLCDATTLRSLGLPPGSLVVCDCEGYELELFTPEVVEAVRHCDLLIEAHDFLNRAISSRLESLFSPTHAVRTIQSLEDALKPKYYDYPEIAALPYSARFEILAEQRPCTMEWLYLQARRPSPA